MKCEDCNVEADNPPCGWCDGEGFIDAYHSHTPPDDPEAFVCDECDGTGEDDHYWFCGECGKSWEAMVDDPKPSSRGEFGCG